MTTIAEAAAVQGAVERAERLLGRKVATTCAPLSGVRKLSDALLEFAGPLLAGRGAEMSLERLDRTLSFASVLWNAYLLPEESSRKELLDHVKEVMISGGIEPDAATREIESLLERRRTLFGDDRRFVTSHAVVEKGAGGGFKVTALYLPIPEAAEAS